MAKRLPLYPKITAGKYKKKVFTHKINSEVHKSDATKHKTVRLILQLREQHTDRTTRPGQLQTSFQCIYIIFHLHSRMVYIGQTQDNILARFNSHLGSARQQDKHLHNHLYLHFRNHGLSDVYLLPLQIIRGTYARRNTPSSSLPYFHTVAAPIEQKWMDLFAAHPHFSLYNSSSAIRNYAPTTARTGAAVTTSVPPNQNNNPSSQETTFPSQESVPSPSPPSQRQQNTNRAPHRGGRIDHSRRGGRQGGRRYIDHDYAAKVKDLASKLNHGRFSLDNLDYFEDYGNRTLQRTNFFLQNASASSLQISTAVHTKLRAILEAAVATRFPPRRDVFTSYKLIKIPGDFQPYFDFLDLSAVFNRLKTFLPAGVTLKPIISPNFTNPISSIFNNTHTIARYSPATISSIQSSPCSCSSSPFQPLVHPALDHVCTSDVNILPTSSLRSLAKMGTNYRIGLSGFTVDQATREEALQNALQAFTKFSTRYENGLRINGWEAWRQHLQAYIQEQIDTDLPIGRNITIPTNTSGLPFSQADYHALRHFQRNFVITAVDKAAMSFAFVCKKLYIQWIKDDLTNSTVFQLKNITAADLIASLDALIPPQARHVLTMGPGSIPNYICTVKLHKPIPQPRFIVSAASCYSTPAAKLLCTLLAALDPFTISLLKDVFTMLNNHLSSLPSSSTTPTPSVDWHGHHIILRNAIDMVDRSNSFNAAHTNAEVQFQTGDVSRLYTNLQLNALLTRLVALYTTLFAKYGFAIKVFDSPAKESQWMASYTPATARSGGTGYDRYTIFTLDDLKYLLKFIIQHNYIHFGQEILKQDQGITMGGNASVYIANHFLFTYELDFYSQLQQLVASSTSLQLLDFLPTTEPPNRQQHYDSGSVALYILTFFQWLFRFIDDIISINNDFLENLLYTNQIFFGIRGIYPPELLITLSPKEPTSNYLDIALSSMHGNGRSPLKTTFYNKFSKPEFAALSVIRYTHNSSNLARRIKDNILTGRFHALRRNITDRSSFCQATAMVIAQLIRRGYNTRRLFRRLFSLLKSHPYLYGHAARTTQQRITHLVTTLLTENSS